MDEKIDRFQGDERAQHHEHQIMTPKSTAKYLGLHLITVYRLIKNGELPGFKIGGQWRLKKDVLDEWIDSRINHKN
ncbi:helix-turn-helix domain-containing protein [Candidatus Omnitrophota bacterium]